MKACGTLPIATSVLNPRSRKGKWLFPRLTPLTPREKAFDTHWRLGGTTFDLEAFEDRQMSCRPGIQLCFLGCPVRSLDLLYIGFPHQQLLSSEIWYLAHYRMEKLIRIIQTQCAAPQVGHSTVKRKQPVVRCLFHHLRDDLLKTFGNIRLQVINVTWCLSRTCTQGRWEVGVFSSEFRCEQWMRRNHTSCWTFRSSNCILISPSVAVLQRAGKRPWWYLSVHIMARESVEEFPDVVCKALSL